MMYDRVLKFKRIYLGTQRKHGWQAVGARINKERLREVMQVGDSNIGEIETQRCMRRLRTLSSTEHGFREIGHQK